PLGTDHGTQREDGRLVHCIERVEERPVHVEGHGHGRGARAHGRRLARPRAFVAPMPWSRSQNVVSTLGMRKLALLAVPLLAACTTASEAPRKTYPENQEASAHLAKGLALFASAETAAVPSEALAGALPELEAAARLVPSPGNRFAHAR